jgi:hypothetical protein
MALIVLASAPGSQGVTSTALGLALTWPRPVLLVEADPTGGSGMLAGYLRGQATPSDSLIDLALAHRQGQLLEAIPAATMPLPDSTVSLIPGTRAHGQARSLTGLWEPLTAALRAVEGMAEDVIVDAGRLGLAGWPEPLVYGADLTLLVARTDLVALSGARSWAQTLREGFTRHGGSASLGVLLVGHGDPYTAREIAKVLALPVTASLAWDPGAARVFAKGAKAPHKFDSAPLVRSLRAARSAIEATVASNREQLAPAPAGGPR